MSCVVGLVHNGNVWMGADAQATDGNLGKSTLSSAKVFPLYDDMLVGFVGSGRYGQLLRWCLQVPDHDPRMEDELYMVGPFVDCIRDALKEGGWALVENGQETGGTCLVGYRGRIWRIGSDFSVFSWQQDYDAIGCGDFYALGSLHTTAQDPRWVEHPRMRILAALESAAAHNAGVAPPFVTYVLESDGTAFTARELTE